MKIIFLDIDGVLNNADDDILWCSEGHYCPILVDRLNHITDATGAKIVLSSTWRLGRDLDEIKSFLFEMDVSGEVIDRTESLPYPCLRGNEIYKWIKDNVHILDVDYYSDFKSYVILDDDGDMLYWQRDNFVQTHGQIGLTEELTQTAINILNNH